MASLFATYPPERDPSIESRRFRKEPRFQSETALSPIEQADPQKREQICKKLS